MHVAGKGQPNSRPLLIMTFSFESLMDMLGITLPILALSLSASPFEIGLLATSRAVVYGLFTFVSGYISDKLDRRRMLVYSMLIISVVGVCYYFSTTPWELIVLGLFNGLAMAIFWPTMEALIVSNQSSGMSEPLRNFNVSWAVGAMVGPLIGGILISLFGVRVPFPVVIAIAVINAILIMRQAPYENIAKKNEETKTTGFPMELISASIFLGAITTIFLAFFPAFGIRRGFSAFEIGVMLFFFGLTRAILFFKTPSKIGLPSSIVLASLGLFLVYIGNKITMYVGTIIAASAFSFLYMYSIEHFLKGEDETRGRRAGIFEGSVGIGAVLGSFFAGVVAELSLSYAFLVASLIGLAFVAALKVTKFRKHHASSKQ